MDYHFFEKIMKILQLLLSFYIFELVIVFSETLCAGRDVFSINRERMSVSSPQ